MFTRRWLRSRTTGCRFSRTLAQLAKPKHSLLRASIDVRDIHDLVVRLIHLLNHSCDGVFVKTGTDHNLDEEDVRFAKEVGGAGQDLEIKAFASILTIFGQALAAETISLRVFTGTETCGALLLPVRDANVLLSSR